MIDLTKVAPIETAPGSGVVFAAMHGVFLSRDKSTTPIQPSPYGGSSFESNGKVYINKKGYIKVYAFSVGVKA